MKIVDRKTFLALPSGTVYRKFTPAVFDEIEIKRSDSNDVYSPDYVTLRLDSVESPEMYDWLDVGSEFRFDYDATRRDAMFEEDQLFAVYDKQDLVELIHILSETL